MGQPITILFDTIDAACDRKIDNWNPSSCGDNSPEVFAHSVMESDAKLPRAEVIWEQQEARKSANEDRGERRSPKVIHIYTSLVPYRGSRDAFTYLTSTRKQMPDSVKADGILGTSNALVISCSGENLTAEQAIQHHHSIRARIDDFMADLKADLDRFEADLRIRLVDRAQTHVKRLEDDQRDLDVFAEGLKKKPPQS